jgi:hypothetical protein
MQQHQGARRAARAEEVDVAKSHLPVLGPIIHNAANKRNPRATSNVTWLPKTAAVASAS